MDGGVFVVTTLSILAGTLICCLPFILVFWLVARRKQERTSNGQEEDRLRSIWDGLQKMESRLENLETIVRPGRRRAERRSTVGTERESSDF